MASCNNLQTLSLSPTFSYFLIFSVGRERHQNECQMNKAEEEGGLLLYRLQCCVHHHELNVFLFLLRRPKTSIHSARGCDPIIRAPIQHMDDDSRERNKQSPSRYIVALYDVILHRPPPSLRRRPRRGKESIYIYTGRFIKRDWPASSAEEKVYIKRGDRVNNRVEESSGAEAVCAAAATTMTEVKEKSVQRDDGRRSVHLHPAPKHLRALSSNGQRQKKKAPPVNLHNSLVYYYCRRRRRRRQKRLGVPIKSELWPTAMRVLSNNSGNLIRAGSIVALVPRSTTADNTTTSYFRFFVRPGPVLHLYCCRSLRFLIECKRATSLYGQRIRRRRRRPS